MSENAVGAEFERAIAAWTDKNLLYKDLSVAKSDVTATTAKLASAEWKYLRGILARYTPAEIAACCGCKNRKAVESCLSRSIYPYVEQLVWNRTQRNLFQEREDHRYRYRRVREILVEELGYRPDALPETERESINDAIASVAILSAGKSVEIESYWGQVEQKEPLFGREKELASLKQLICGDRRRVIVLMGVPWMGKTALAAQLAKVLEKEAAHKIFWFHMDTIPSFEDFVRKLKQEWGKDLDLAGENPQETLRKLLTQLATFPYLIVLDRMETIIDQGQYLETHEDYEYLFELACQVEGQGCVLVTTSKPITHLEFLENDKKLVRSFTLEGIDPTAVEQIFATQDVKADKSTEYEVICDAYSGRPGFILYLARHYRKTYNGKIVVLNEWKTLFLDDIMKRLLQKQWKGLSDNEKLLVKYLNSHKTPISVQKFYETAANSMSHSEFNIAYKNLLYELFIKSVYTNNDEIPEIVLEPLIKKYI